MQVNNFFEMGAVNLGAFGLTASWRRSVVDAKLRYQPAVMIQCASGGDDGVHIPACDIVVSGVDGLLALRNAIDCALRYDRKDQVYGVVERVTFNAVDNRYEVGVGADREPTVGQTVELIPKQE